MRNTADVTGGKPIAVLLQSISRVSAINPLVAFYDIHGGKRGVQFFYFVPDTTQDFIHIKYRKDVLHGWFAFLDRPRGNYVHSPWRCRPTTKTFPNNMNC
jgi:hypothetical protein